MSEAGGVVAQPSPHPHEGICWIEEEANRFGFLFMLTESVFVSVWLGIAPFTFGISSGVSFLVQGFTFTAGPGWWSVSAACYLLLFANLVLWGMTIRYRLRGQIIGVGITDAGVHFRTRRTDRLVPWEKFRPKPSTMDRGRGYVIEATNPKSWIGVSLLVVGPRSGAAIIADPRFPRPP